MSLHTLADALLDADRPEVDAAFYWVAHFQLREEVHRAIPGRLTPGERRVRTAALKVLHRREYWGRHRGSDASLDRHMASILDAARVELAEAVGMTVDSPTGRKGRP